MHLRLQVKFDLGLLLPEEAALWTRVEGSMQSSLFLSLQAQDSADHSGDPIPIFRLDRKLFLAFSGDRVKPRLAVVF